MEKEPLILTTLKKKGQQALRFKKLEADSRKFKASIINNDLGQEKKEAERINSDIEDERKETEKK